MGMIIIIDPIRDEDGNITGETATLVGAPPPVNILGKDYVEMHIERGWIRFDGEPVTLDLEADPVGPMKGMKGMKLEYPGDKLVLTVLRKQEDPELPMEQEEVVYHITHFPIPQGFRHLDDRQVANDDTEQEGIRIAPEYGLELVS